MARRSKPSRAIGCHDGADDTLPANSLPMMGGVGGFGYITMGGMVTLLKVRNDLADDRDPGHYAHPAGTVADVASADELARDGIRGATQHGK